MKFIGIIKNEETMFTVTSSDSHRGGGTVWCIGNGQLHDAMQIEKEVCKTLNCMADPMKILVTNGTDRTDKGRDDPED